MISCTVHTRTCCFHQSQHCATADALVLMLVFSYFLLLGHKGCINEGSYLLHRYNLWLSWLLWHIRRCWFLRIVGHFCKSEQVVRQGALLGLLGSVRHCAHLRLGAFTDDALDCIVLISLRLLVLHAVPGDISLRIRKETSLFLYIIILLYYILRFCYLLIYLLITFIHDWGFK